MNHSIFICYRRSTGSAMARMIYDRLRLERNYQVFLDVETLSAGDFHKNIDARMAQCDIFLLVLTKDALVRCSNPGDNVRQEILSAKRLGLTMIPVTSEDFLWPDTVAEDLREIVHYNALPYVQVYSDYFFERLYSFIESSDEPEDVLPPPESVLPAVSSRRLSPLPDEPLIPRAVRGAAFMVLLLIFLPFFLFASFFAGRFSLSLQEPAAASAPAETPEDAPKAEPETAAPSREPARLRAAVEAPAAGQAASDEPDAAGDPTSPLLTPYSMEEGSALYSGDKTFSMAGEEYTDGVTLSFDFERTESFFLVNLAGEYEAVHFILGHVDASQMLDVTVAVYLDEVLFETYEVRCMGMPRQLDIPVRGIRQLKIIATRNPNAQGDYYPVTGFAALTGDRDEG